MATIWIIGNSGAARECYWLLQDVFRANADFAASHRFGGFFDWKGHAGNLAELEGLHKGCVDDYASQADDLFVIGIGQPALRAEVFASLKQHGADFMNLVHPLADICPSASLGEGNIFHRHSTVYANARLGNGNYLNGHVNLSHDSSIGDFNFLAPYSIVLGNASIGSCNHLGPHSVVLDHAHMGDANVLAPGSAMYKGCGNNCRMMGNPALKVGDTGD